MAAHYSREDRKTVRALNEKKSGKRGPVYFDVRRRGDEEERENMA